MLAFFTQLIADKRAAPADDLLSALIAVRDKEDRLSEDELMSLAFLILFAGYENTVHLIGNATLALLSHPDQLATLRANPDRLGGAVEELARYDGPTPLAIRRFPREDITSAASRSRQARPFCCPSPPPTATRTTSPTPTASTSATTRPVTLPSATASTTASAHPWPGWRPRSPSPRSSTAFRG